VVSHAALASSSISVIVRGAPGCADTVAADVHALGGRTTRQIGILDGGSAVLPQASLAALSTAPCVVQVTPDTTLAPQSIGTYDPTTDAASLYNTTVMIGAQSAWKSGYTGQGIGVAVIDTGTAAVQGLNAASQVVNGIDVSFDSQSTALTRNDEYGHGTHLAGIIAGNDLYGQKKSTSYAGNTTSFLGVAPDAHILSVKAGDEQGVTDVSQIVAAIDWVVQHRNDNTMNIKVINLSYGTNSTQAYALDPLTYASEVAWRAGIVVVAAAGNNGGSSTTGLTDPALDPYVIAVGAADTQNTVSTGDDTVASFSSTGNGTRNPDLVAPGVHIASLRDPGSNIDLQFGSTADVGTRFFRGSGTSQATAVISGAAALYLSDHKTATPDQVKIALTSTASKLTTGTAAAQGAGEVNVSKALTVVPTTKQGFTQSTGTGTLEAARGGNHIISQRNGVALVGEEDILGHTWSSSSIAKLESTQTAWSGGTFNGSGWSGSGWSGSGWSGAQWSGSGWSGTAWSGSTWLGSTWTGSGWSGSGWSGSGWSGSGWSGSGWSGSGWSNGVWVGSGWADYSWR
jgi:serine protease AprX